MMSTGTPYVAALAVIAGLTLSFTAEPVQAQTGRTTIWSSTLTVSDDGFWIGCGTKGDVRCDSAMTDHSLVWEGVSYRIREFLYAIGQTTNFSIEFDKDIPSFLRSEATLHIPGRDLHFNDAVPESFLYERGWRIPSPGWAAGQQISVSVTVPSQDRPTGLSAVAGDRRVLLSWNNPNRIWNAHWEYRMRAGRGNWSEWYNIAGDDERSRPDPAYVRVGPLLPNHDKLSDDEKFLKNGTTYGFQVRTVGGPHSTVVTATPEVVPVVWTIRGLC